MVNDQDGKPTSEEGKNAPRTHSEQAGGDGNGGGVGRALARVAYAPGDQVLSSSAFSSSCC